MAAGTRNDSNTNTADREIVVTRVFDAPRELIWKAWTDPKHIAQWWGPRGFTMTIHELDLRPGGVWRHTLHGPDGTKYPTECIFHEIKKPERIAYSLSGGKLDAARITSEVTWIFEAQGDKTKLTLRMVFSSTEERDHNEKTYRVIEGGTQTLDRFAEYLTKGLTSGAN